MSSFDITFCSNLECKNKECKRNQTDLIRSGIWKFPISIADFRDCKYWEKAEEEK